MLSSCLSEDMDFLGHKLPFEFPYTDSVPSPVESVVSSTESDEDDYVLSLSNLMAHTALQNDGEYIRGEKFGEMGGSPQSPLRSAWSWSHASSTPSTPLDQKNDCPELMYAASGRLAGMKICDQDCMISRGGPFAPPKKFDIVGLSKSGAPMERSDFSCHPSLRCCWSDNDGDSSAISLKIKMLKEQQFLWRKTKISEAQQIHGCSRAAANFKNGRSLRSPSSAWPLIQEETPNGEMRVIVLGGSGSRRESSGTGVFLPRRAGNPSEFRKKSGVSTVLLPARVVQALNLSVDNRDAVQTSYCPGKLVHGRDPSINIDLQPFVSPRNGFLPPQNRFVRTQPHAVSNELGLPQEWTY